MGGQLRRQKLYRTLLEALQAPSDGDTHYTCVLEDIQALLEAEDVVSADEEVSSKPCPITASRQLGAFLWIGMSTLFE